jgi:uncharacterized protein YoxC
MLYDNWLLNLLLIVTIIVLILVAGFLIPCLLNILRAARGMTQTLQMVNQSLPVILRDLEAMTTNMGRTAVTVHRQVEELSATIRAVQGTLGLIVGLGEVVRRRMPVPFLQVLRTSLAVARGIRVFAARLAEQTGDRREP